MKVDFGRTADDYAAHRAGFPVELFARLRARGIGVEGQRVLDVGTGTGTLAIGMASAGAEVTGIDIAPPLLARAASAARIAGVAVRFLVARAEQTGLPDASFDAVTAGQCWHWLAPAAAAPEMRRVLAPNGRLCICHFDWIPLPGNVVAATEALIERHNSAWTLGGGTGIYPQWARQVAVAGFTDIETFSFDVDVRYEHDAWRGRIRASAGVGGSLQPDAVAAFDRELEALLAAEFPADPLAVPHRCWALVCRAQASSSPASSRK